MTALIRSLATMTRVVALLSALVTYQPETPLPCGRAVCLPAPVIWEILAYVGVI